MPFNEKSKKETGGKCGGEICSFPGLWEELAYDQPDYDEKCQADEYGTGGHYFQHFSSKTDTERRTMRLKGAMTVMTTRK